MPQLRGYKPLRIIAADQDDLKTMSSYVQDAIFKVGDMAWLSAQRRFAFVANRYVWEAKGAQARVRSGLHFDDVISVQHKNIRLDAQEAVVSLMAIQYSAGEGDEGHPEVTLSFSGGGTIRLVVEAVNVELSDISDPWQTRSRPDHDTAS